MRILCMLCCELLKVQSVAGHLRDKKLFSESHAALNTRLGKFS
jgi:hypothetical protein